MYKVGHSSAVPRSTLVYNGRRNVPARSGIYEKTLNQYGAENEKPCRNEMNMQIPALSKRNHSRVSPDAKKRVNMETVSVLMKATEEFLRTPDGRPDKTIKQYRPKTQLPEDFVPFDVENYLTERFLRDVNLDPKILNGFCK
uniref:PPP1R35_C domain-containing protein n=1 Tax=Elaeophora elaphi TaxID=1147741 RepID=A0A0R3S0C7_9BILA